MSLIKRFRQKPSEATTKVSATELVFSSQNSKAGWADLYYGNVETLIRLISAVDVVECGVAYGGHASDLLRNLSQINYTGIDPYLYGYDENDPFSSAVENFLGMHGQAALDSLYVAVDESLSIFKNRAQLIREDSVGFAERQKNVSFDLVFLDDNHQFDYVSKELECWWPLIRQGGILCGDDYWMSGVKKAVDAFASSHELPLRFISKNEYKTFFFLKERD